MTKFYVLAVDQASQDGMTFFDSFGTLLVSGIARNTEQRVSFLTTCLGYADGPVVGVVEGHAGIPMSMGGRGDKRGGRVTRGTAQLLGIGAARGRWETLFDIFGVRWTKVDLHEWRARVLGLKRNTKGEKAKEEAVKWASARFDTTKHQVDIHDVAESACMGLLATTLSKVSDLAKMRPRKALVTLQPGGWSFGIEE